MRRHRNGGVSWFWQGYGSSILYITNHDQYAETLYFMNERDAFEREAISGFACQCILLVIGG